jgi:poly-gamma-glutamate synthesis protein (capsule biosynthesis protein)
MSIINFIKKYKFYFLAGLIVLIILAWPLFINGSLENNFNKSDISKFFSSNNHFQKIGEPISVPVVPVVANNILVFGGDIMLSRTVNQKMETYQNYQWPLEKIATLFSEADLAIANLESPFLLNSKYDVKTGSFSFKANPKSVTALSLAGFDVLSLANNHILNQGVKGLKDTYQVLREAGISYVGTKDSQLVVKESQGVKFAFLSYSYDSSSPLIANLDVEQLALDVKQARTKADVVIILMHAGTEYTRQPNWQQKEFAHAAINNGADLVVGHHPHWPQTVENYQGKTIIYSLGNLVFDQMWSKETSEGLVVKAYFKDKALDHLEYIPISISDYGQAVVMPDGQTKDKLLSNILIKN